MRYEYRYVQFGGSCTSVWLFIIFPVLLQSLNTQGCLCFRAPRCFNTSSPSLSSSGLILSECRWGQLKPPRVSSQLCHCRTKQGPRERGGARKKGGRRSIIRKAVRTKDCRKWCTLRKPLSWKLIIERLLFYWIIDLDGRTMQNLSSKLGECFHCCK